MKLNHIILTGLVFLLGAGGLSAQQVYRRSQFVFNPYLVNPAFAGTKNYTPLLLSYRNQWSGFEGAPVTYTLSGHTSLPHNIGIGGIVFSDNTGGAISRTGVELTGSYKVDLTNEDQISFGLSPVLGQFKFNNDSLVVYDPNDQALLGNQESEFYLDANFGMVIYGRNYMFGFAVPNIMQSKLNVETNAGEYENRNIRHYLLMGSYKYFVSETFDLQPSLLAKFTGITPVQFDVNVKATYADFLWGGLGYRHQDAVIIFMGVEYQGFTFGYGYDITTTDARNFSPHTHELTLGYYFPRTASGFNANSLSGKRIISRRRISK